MRRERSRPLAFAVVSAAPALRPPPSSFVCPVHPLCAPPAHAPRMVARADHDVADTRVRVRPDHNINLQARPYYGAVSRDSPSALGDHAKPPDDARASADAARPDAGQDAPPQLDLRLIAAAVAFLAALAVGGVAAVSGVLSPDRLVALSEWFETLGPSAVFLYSGLYFLLELVGVPALPLTLGSGYLFGVVKGTIAVSAASTAASAAAFLIARYGLRDSVSKLASRYPRFRAMDRAIGREGFKFVLLLRLSPLLPFSISNYLYGLTSVNLAPYVAGSWLGMLPGTIAYVSAGAAVNTLTDLSVGGADINPGLVALGLAATVGALWTVGKMATRAIESEEEEEEVTIS